MVKRLQTLRVKKGFTLVELIVVIAMVVSADSTAKEIVQTVNAWISSVVSSGGNEYVAEDVTITMDGGSAAVSGAGSSSIRADDGSGNDWEVADVRGVESLKDRFETDYSARTFTATVFVDVSGYAVYAWVVPDKGDYSGDAPDGAAFAANGYDWKSDKKEGVTQSGAVVGTYPKLHYTSSAS